MPRERAPLQPARGRPRARPQTSCPAEARTCPEVPRPPSREPPPSTEEREAREPPPRMRRPSPEGPTARRSLQPVLSFRSGREERGGQAPATGHLQTEKQTLSDWPSYIGLSFLLQMFSFREGNVALRGSQ